MNSIYYISILFFFLFSTLIGYILYRKYSKKSQGPKRNALPRLIPTDDKEHAGEQLLVYLNEEFKYSGKEIAVYEGVECNDGSGWLFFWDAAAFIMAKNQDAAFAGSNPIYFNKQTGEIRYIQPQSVGPYIGQARPE